ncbi:SusC/RagA family TonB-linked outer membrane protein [Epilithonimonas sp.]|uniref:SusC/RagA family TonB-linked outer membrane protein n=1 Tax=Epilithonimonas sp. TaxID=2894511 RepID=UPI0028AE033B|nr:SusC/RagA family TonB-linked outer membrane protein [Epilithonimonas sp.]
MLTTVSTQSKAQTRSISGTVTTSGKPLQGVIISQEGSDQVTMTANNGTYTIQVSAENPILLFRHPDYAEEKFTLTNQTVVNISLEQHVKGIEEVILNAGYYKVKERESTGSIAKVSSRDIENQPVTNVLSAVQGRMPGVSITQNSGTPGGGYDIQIRGRNSLRNITNSTVDGNQPLYVVDGVPIGGQLNAAQSLSILPLRNISPLNSINPNDIESIEILKDADATAIYGSRGANGVVLVTTKKGKKGRLSLNLNTSYNIGSVVSHLEMMNSEDYLKMRRQAYANDGITTIPAAAYDVNGSWDANRYTDWQKLLIGRRAEGSMTQASISGGSENNSFMLSFSHNDQGSVFSEGYHYKTNILNSSFSHHSSDKRLRLELSNMFSSLTNNVVSADQTTKALILSPNAPAVYDASGNLNWENNTFSNPLANLISTYSNKILQWNSNANLSYRFWNDWTFKTNGGINYQTIEDYNLKPSTMYNPAFGMTSTSSTALKSNNSLFSYIIEPQLAWDKKWGRHKLDILVGTSFQHTEGQQASFTGVGFASNALITNIGAATTQIISAQTNTPYKYAAVYTRMNYQFKERYILNLTGRRDASSRFGPNKRVANFGAAGAAWLFTQESIFDNSSWISFGKLRTSYGITGSDFIGDYQYLNTYTIGSLSYDNVSGLYPSRLYNPDYSWEKTKKLEAALELGFLKDRLMLTASWYRNRSSDQLVGIPLPSVTGFSSVIANLDATVENSGWELAVNANILRSSDWRWESGMNLTLPKNKLISFPGLEGSTYANTYKIGYPTSMVKVFQYEGIDPTTGRYTFKDFNGDGKISSPDDAQAVENIGMKYFGGWYNQLSYKNVSLSFLFYFVKQKNWNYIRTMPTPGTMNNLPVELMNVWSADNPGGIIMPYSSGTNAQVNTLTANYRNSTAAIGDASFIRLKNVQLNYRIQGQDHFFKDAVIYVQGQNLWTWTNYFGLDPEFSVTGYLPPLKTWSIGLQLNF